MSWQTPKMGWTPADGVSDADMNRIEENIAIVSQYGGPFGETSGTAAVYTVNPSPPLYFLVDGALVAIKAHVQNTGTATLNVNGLGPVNMRRGDGSALKAGDLKVGHVYTFRYTNGAFELQGGGLVDFATEAEAKAGTINDKASSPLGVTQYVGQFGIGAENPPLVTDLDPVTASGSYSQYNASTLGRPSLAISGFPTTGVVHTLRRTSDRLSQIAYGLGGNNDPRIAVRVMGSSGWGVWAEQLHTGNIESNLAGVGLGSGVNQPAKVTDLNNERIPGVIGYGNTTLNRPDLTISGFPNAGMVFVVRDSVNRISQLAFGMAGSDAGRLAIRAHGSTTWGVWNEIAMTNVNNQFSAHQTFNDGISVFPNGVNDVYMYIKYGAFTKNLIRVWGGDTNGFGVSISAGGATLIAAGEADAQVIPNVPFGTEDLIGAADRQVTFYSNLQSGWASRREMTFNNAGQLVVNGLNVNTEIADLKSSVSDGKNRIASAITDMGGSATGSDTFAQMESKIRDNGGIISRANLANPPNPNSGGIYDVAQIGQYYLVSFEGNTTVKKINAATGVINTLTIPSSYRVDSITSWGVYFVLWCTPASGYGNALIFLHSTTNAFTIKKTNFSTTSTRSTRLCVSGNTLYLVGGGSRSNEGNTNTPAVNSIELTTGSMTNTPLNTVGYIGTNGFGNVGCFFDGGHIWAKHYNIVWKMSTAGVYTQVRTYSHTGGRPAEGFFFKYKNRYFIGESDEAAGSVMEINKTTGENASTYVSLPVVYTMGTITTAADGGAPIFYRQSYRGYNNNYFTRTLLARISGWDRE